MPRMDAPRGCFRNGWTGKAGRARAHDWGLFALYAPHLSRSPSGRGYFALCATAPLPCPPFHLYMHAYTILYAHVLRGFRL